MKLRSVCACLTLCAGLVVFSGNFALAQKGGEKGGKQGGKAEGKQGGRPEPKQPEKPGAKNPGGGAPKTGGNRNEPAPNANRNPNANRTAGNTTGAKKGAAESSGPMDDFLGGPAHKSTAAANPGRATGAAAGTRPAGEKAVAGNAKEKNAATTPHPDYATDAAGWKERQAATGNAVRANSGGRYAAAYNSGAYRTGAVGGYPYAAAGAGAAAASYAGLGSFLGAGWAGAAAKPTYYGYGNGGNVYYENNNVYVAGQKAGTAAEYSRQASEMVAAAPPADQVSAVADDWMPLGVFALTREAGEDALAMIELAVNKQGVIGGTFYNESTGLSRSLKGTADPKTQRVAVGFADGENQDIVLDTGLYNLTQDEAPGLLHRGEDESQPVLLVRLPNSEESSEGK